MTDHATEATHFTAMAEEAMALHGIDGEGAAGLRKIVAAATRFAADPATIDPLAAGRLASSMHRGVKTAEASTQIIRACLTLVVSRAAADGLAREVQPGIWHFGPEEDTADATLAVTPPVGSA